MTYEKATATRDNHSTTITIIGKPQVWSAPTFSKRGAYDKKWQQKRDAYLLLSELALPSITHPLSIEITYHLQMPKAWSQKRRKERDKTYHSAHLDLDNLNKFICDTLQKALIIKDDCLIVEHHNKKLWSTEPKTILTLTPLEDT